MQQPVQPAPMPVAPQPMQQAPIMQQTVPQVPVAPQPVQTMQAQPRPAKQGNKKMLPLILAIAGGVVEIALIVTIVLVVINRSSGSVPEGEGTALVDMLDDAAYNYQMNGSYEVE